ncbi:MAG: PTS sugar transporter subunit IIA [Candidatus Omnitrophica bacterium]|nr:PTS sugar transporter subunit IIA [Candidatus Omnitrophota bacterium]
MKIMDFLNKKGISVNLKSKDKDGVIKELVDLIVKTGKIRPKDKDALVKIICDRESLGSTGIGQGIGIPHGKSQAVKELTGACAISKDGVNFDSLDGEPVHIFFLLLAPHQSAGPHLKALARISRLLKDKYFRDMLKNAPTEKALINIIGKEDQKRH